MHYEAILFDFDGVLVDSEPVHWRCWNEVLAPFGAHLDWDRYCAHCIGVSDREMIATMCAQFDPPLLFDSIWAQYPRKKDLFRLEMLATDSVSGEVRQLIDRLRGNFLLGVVTSSGRREVEPILEKAGVLPYVNTVVYGDDVRNLKPAPDPYLLAVDRLGVKRGLVIEDSDAGLASACAAGLDVLHVPSQAEMCGLVEAKLGLQG